MTRALARPLARPLIAVAAAFALLLSMSPSPASAQTQETTGSVAGTTIQAIQLPLVDGQEFVGRITDLRVVEGVVEGEDALLASGRIVGRILDDAGNVVQRVNQTFAGVDITDLLTGDTDPNGSCQILFLELGPLFLDVLGLVVEIPDPIVVEIRAEPGPGALLGNLLCALVGILD
jgi:hypothetical protein